MDIKRNNNDDDYDNNDADHNNNNNLAIKDRIKSASLKGQAPSNKFHANCSIL